MTKNRYALNVARYALNVTRNNKELAGNKQLVLNLAEIERQLRLIESKS